jgi:hypothetical protein
MSQVNSIAIATPRRRTRGRLTILVGLLLIACLCYVFGLRLDLNFAPRGVRGAKGDRLIAEVERLGGRIQGGQDSGGFYGLGNVELYRVNLTGLNIGDDDLERLVPTLSDRTLALDLRGTRVTDAGLKHLRGLSRLSELSLGGLADPSGLTSLGSITDTGLDQVAQLSGLRELTLDHTAITDAGLARLRPSSELADLTLRENHLRGSGLAHLKGMNLTHLLIEDPDLDDDELRHLAGQVKLQYLMLYRLTLTAKGYGHLGRLSGLVGLWLNGCGVGDKNLGTLKASLPRTIIYP